MTWKLNSEGEYQYFLHDPEKIEEMDTCVVCAFGVSVCTRTGQVHELVEMLTFLNALARSEPEMLRTIKSILWDSKGGVVNIELREDRVPAVGTHVRKALCDEIAKQYLAVARGVQLTVSGSNEWYEVDFDDLPPEHDDSNVVTFGADRE